MESMQNKVLRIDHHRFWSNILGATFKEVRLTMTIPLAGPIMVHHQRTVSSLTYAYPVGTSPDSDSNALVAGLLNVIINRLEQAHQ